MYYYFLYRTIGVGACCFGLCLAAGVGVGRFLGIFTLGDVFVSGGLVFITSNLVCDVSLWGYFCGVVFCLNIFVNFLTDCSFSIPMVLNGAARYGLDMASIRYSTVFVDYY